MMTSDNGSGFRRIHHAAASEGDNDLCIGFVYESCNLMDERVRRIRFYLIEDGDLTLATEATHRILKGR